MMRVLAFAVAVVLVMLPALRRLRDPRLSMAGEYFS